MRDVRRETHRFSVGRTLVRRIGTLCFLTYLFTALTACQPEPESELLKFVGPTMGTSFKVLVVPNDVEVPDNLEQTILDSLNLVNDQMSTYQSNSQISALNNLAVGESMQLAPEFVDVLWASRRVFEESGGAFEPTVGPLVDLWGFGVGEDLAQVPDSAKIDEARAQVGFDYLSLVGTTVSKSAPIRLDLSAVAKGYAADLVSSKLSDLGLVNHLVEVGGENRVSGNRLGGGPWRLGVEKPEFGRGEPKIIFGVTNAGVATSGDYRIYFEQDGVRYSHTIDPRTGYPVTHKLASVTVIADNCARADALATAFMVLGEERTLTMAEELALPVYLLVKEGDGFVARHSSAFQRYLPEQ